MPMVKGQFASINSRFRNTRSCSDHWAVSGFWRKKRGVRISTGGTDGKYVVADAVQSLPVADKKRKSD
jgi:hypothetical protein